MVIITDGNGNIQAPTIPENVYQGSNNANQIVFLSPLPQSNVATISFRLPNGVITQENIMTSYTSMPNEYPLNAWVYNIDETLTALYGTVTYQVRLTNSQGTRIASVGGTFQVERGVAPLPSETPSASVYEQILEYLSSFQSDILENGWLVSKGILPYDENFTYPINASIIDIATQKIYTSLIDDNLGNPLSDTNSWSPTSFVTPADVDDLLALKVDKQTTRAVTNGTQTNNIKNETTGITNEVKINRSQVGVGVQNLETSLKLDGVNTILKSESSVNALVNSKEIKITEDSVKIYTTENNTSDGGYEIATINDIGNKQDKLTAGNNITISEENVISSGIENNYSNSQETPYSANYINSNFVPLTFASRIYLSKTSSTTANLVDTQPTASASNLLTTTTTNTSFDWDTPMITLTRTLEQAITLNTTNSFAVDLYFSMSKNEKLSFGAKIKVSTDNGSTWTYISSNQSYADKEYNQGLNSEDIIVYTDLATETTYNIGDLLAIEIYTKQEQNSSLTIDYYCGVEVDGSNIYSFVEFNFANININTEQIEDGAITYDKLSDAVKSLISGGSNLTGASDPTTSTVGEVGQLYLNTTSGILFICLSVSGATYNWSIVNINKSGSTAIFEIPYDSNNKIQLEISSSGVARIRHYASGSSYVVELPKWAGVLACINQIFPTFSSSSPYNVGDLVSYNNYFYKCTTAITTPGDWDANDWTITTLVQELATKENIVNKVTSISGSSTDTQYPSAKCVYDTIQSGVPYSTTAPSADNLNGNLKLVVLSSEPATKYNGYVYFITEQ